MTSSAIVFVSLLLGLVTGPREIEVAVAEDVESVRLLLDRELIAELHGEPWRASVDFGPELRTQRLVAVAFDGAGQELGTAEQLVNLPRPPVEAEILLEGWVDRSPTAARLIWKTTRDLEPKSISMTLDGSPVAPSASGRLDLPRLDPAALHFVTAEISFPDGTAAAAEAVFGGAYGSSVETELTAVPLVFGRRQPRSAGDARGWLRDRDGRDLAVVAVDDAPAEIAIVREDAAIAPLEYLERAVARRRDVGFRSLRLDKRDLLRFVSPRPSGDVRLPAQGYTLFPISQAFAAADGSLPRLLHRVTFDDGGATPQRLTTAIAVAGRLAAQTRRRRAVIFVTARCAGLGTRRSSEAVLEYLRELHVPLKVWQVGPIGPQVREAPLCEAAERLTTPGEFRRAILALRAELRRQRIVWVRGRLLPREIELTPAARAIRLAGR